jgi:hypothetical protein
MYIVKEEEGCEDRYCMILFFHMHDGKKLEHAFPPIPKTPLSVIYAVSLSAPLWFHCDSPCEFEDTDTTE